MVIIDSSVEAAVADFASATKGNVSAGTVVDMLTRQFSRKKYQTFDQTLAELREYTKVVRHVRVWLELGFAPDTAAAWTMKDVHACVQEEGGAYAGYIRLGLLDLERGLEGRSPTQKEIRAYLTSIGIYVRYLMRDVMYHVTFFDI